MCNICNKTWCCKCPQPTNPSNKTYVIPVEGASFIEAYRSYYPEDNRTDKEIIDSQFRNPAEYVPDTAEDAPIEYTPSQINSILSELRAIKQSLIDSGYMDSQ